MENCDPTLEEYQKQLYAAQQRTKELEHCADVHRQTIRTQSDEIQKLRQEIAELSGLVRLYQKPRRKPKPKPAPEKPKPIRFPNAPGWSARIA